MKQRTAYIYGILVIIIILGFLSIRKSAKIQPVFKKPKPQQIETVRWNRPYDYTSVNKKPVITIIRRSPQGKAAVAAQEKIKEPQLSDESSIAPAEAASSSSQGSAARDSESASGITKIGKHPTERENKEMNARGTILF